MIEYICCKVEIGECDGFVKHRGIPTNEKCEHATPHKAQFGCDLEKCGQLPGIAVCRNINKIPDWEV